MTAAENALLNILCVVLTVYTILLFVRVIISWATMFGFRRTILDLLEDVTEPVLRPLRSLIPPIRAGGVGLDLSIIIAFVILAVLRQALNC